jgi:toxin ParE1/3/4
MSHHFKIQPEAEKDLEAIWNYSVENWGINKALEYLDGLDNVFRMLTNNPNISNLFQEFIPPVRIHHHKSHLIVYIVEEERIVIIRVLHESMSLDKQLDN